MLILASVLAVSTAWAEAVSGFAWNRDPLFRALEQQFDFARQQPLASVQGEFRTIAASHRAALDSLRPGGDVTPFGALRTLEETQFRLAALAAAHEPLLPEAYRLITTTRLAVGQVALRWPIERRDVHEAIYRVVYGGRIAIEEALVQQHTSSLPALTLLEDIPSAAPSTMVEGVRVHSGDIILSRGDAPTSALIARGNIFPGNFSHVAIVYVDPVTDTPTIIEALIERGVVTTTVADFLKEKRLRLLLLRLRPDHPALRVDPLAAHHAAGAALARVKARHTPYDFRMDWMSPARMFCSEVAYYAYRSVGIDLWAYKPQLSSPGLVRWLGDMGVKNFTTLIPSDLEYDPKLAPVAEWRNPDALTQDRLDNVTLDVLLEAAEHGDRLGYSPFAYLPGGLAKIWSGVKSALGATPAIPEGMSIETALRVHSLTKNVYPKLHMAISVAAEKFRTEHGYPAPYWALTGLARQALTAVRPELSHGLVVSTGASNVEMPGPGQ